MIEKQYNLKCLGAGKLKGTNRQGDKQGTNRQGDKQTRGQTDKQTSAKVFYA